MGCAGIPNPLHAFWRAQYPIEEGSIGVGVVGMVLLSVC